MRSERSPLPPLYDERFEHAACGLGALIRLDGRQTHELVERATRALRGLEHRGATGADPDTGDGAGIMVQLPDRFLRREFEARFGHGLPEPGGYGGGPRLPAARPGASAALRGALRARLRRGGPSRAGIPRRARRLERDRPARPLVASR